MNDLCRYIDHTLLKPDAVTIDIERICMEAMRHKFKSVCVNSVWAGYAGNLLQHTDVELCCVVGFPFGASAGSVKAFEASYCVIMGATEIDMVMDIGAALEGRWDDVVLDIKNVVRAVKDKAKVKVIIETGLLNNEQKRTACKCVMDAGAHFVKTSTGFIKGGATAEDIELIKSVVGTELGIKASGGIRTRKDALTMISMGATRIGTSSAMNIIL